MRTDDNADAKRILLASPPADWRRQLGRPRMTWLSTIQQDLKHHHLPEAADLAQNHPLWSVEDDVDVWRNAIVSCTPETTTTMLMKYVLPALLSPLSAVVLTFKRTRSMPVNNSQRNLSPWYQ